MLYAVVDPRVTYQVMNASHRLRLSSPSMDELEFNPPTSKPRRPIGGFLARGVAAVSPPQAGDDRAVLRRVSCASSRSSRRLIVGTKPIVCKYKGSIYFPCLGYFNRSWENPIFLQRSLSQRLSGEPQEEGPRELGHLAARVSRSVPPRPRRRMARSAGQSVAAPRPRRVDYNWFGTNQQGFDVFAQMVHGTRIALLRRLRVDGHRRGRSASRSARWPATSAAGSTCCSAG